MCPSDHVARRGWTLVVREMASGASATGRDGSAFRLVPCFGGGASPPGTHRKSYKDCVEVGMMQTVLAVLVFSCAAGLALGQNVSAPLTREAYVISTFDGQKHDAELGSLTVRESRKQGS